MKYNTYMWRYLVCLVLGCVIGYGTYVQSYGTSQPSLPLTIGEFGQYSGVVVHNDTAARNITIQIPNYFGATQASSQQMKFYYDDATLWGTIEYVFENGIVVDRGSTEVPARELPEGTLVSLWRDMQVDTPLRASAILYLQRKTI
jgi:hypothetical protein